MMPRPMNATVVLAGARSPSALIVPLRSCFRCSGPVSGIGRYSDQYHSRVVRCGFAWIWSSGVLLAGAAQLRWQPVEGGRGLGAGQVFQADPAGVSGVIQRGEVAVEGELAGARLVPARCVGDLDVPDPGDVAVDLLGQVVTVDGQVVEVGEQRQVG